MIRKIFKNILSIFSLQYKKITFQLQHMYSATLYYYSMLLTGLILSSIYMYMRFLRTRVPREIPFQLTVTRFLMLCIICSTFLYLIKVIIKPKKHNIILTYFSQYVSKPLQYIKASFSLLDRRIKKSKVINPYYTRLVDYLLPIVLDFSSAERIMLAYCFMIIPGYLLLFILMMDVFWLHEIKIFYYFLFLNILPLFYIYYRYSLTVIREEYFRHLESLYVSILIVDENYNYEYKFNMVNPQAIYHDKEVSIREYFDIQLKHLDTEYLAFDDEDPLTYEIKYVGYPLSHPDILRQQYETSQKSTYDSREEEFRYVEPRLLILIEYIELNQYTHEVAYIKHLRIALYSLYFLTWFYILIKSIHTLPENLGWLKVLSSLIYHYPMSFPKRLFKVLLIISALGLIIKSAKNNAK